MAADPLIKQYIDEHKGDNTKLLESILEIVLKLDDFIRRQHAIENSQPWPFKLVMELNLGSDEDGNGMIFGRDFGLAENTNHVPPSLQPIVGTMLRDRWAGKTLSWEQYLETLPQGTHRDQVANFVRTLPTRHVRPRGDSDAAVQAKR